jgi:hypothetical protein
MDFVQIGWHNFSIRLGKLLREKFRHAERGRSGGETESHRSQTKYSSSAVRYQESAACSLLKETLRKTLQYLFKTEPLLVTSWKPDFWGTIYLKHLPRFVPRTTSSQPLHQKNQNQTPHSGMLHYKACRMTTSHCMTHQHGSQHKQPHPQRLNLSHCFGVLAFHADPTHHQKICLSNI